MATQTVIDTYQGTGTGASIITFSPAALPAGASIGQVFLDAWGNGASIVTLGEASVTFTNLVDGNESSTTEENLTGVLATTTKLTVSNMAWTNTSPDGVATITVGLSAAITNGNYYFFQYIISYDG